MKKSFISCTSFLTLFYVAGLGIYLIYLAVTLGPWIDELYTLHAICLPWFDMVLERLRRGHPPLYFALEKLFWVGTEASQLPATLRLRFLSLATWGVAVILYYQLAKRITHYRACWYSAGLFAFSQIAAPHAANARMYALALLLAVVHFFCFLHIVKVPTLKVSRWTGLFLLSALAGILTTPSFALLTLCMTLALLALCGWRDARTWFAAGTLLICALYYAPALYLYVVTPTQIGPVTKHFSRVLLSVFALLSSVGRGKMPDDGILSQLAIVASAFFSIVLLVRVIQKWDKTSLTLRGALAIFASLFACILTVNIISYVFGLSGLRVGTDRYLVAFVPVGAWLGGHALALGFSPRASFSLYAAVLTTSAFTFAQGNSHEGRVFHKELAAFVRGQHVKAPVILCPPEIREGVLLYSTELKILGDLGMNSNTPENRHTLLSKAAEYPECFVIYYRAHVPELLATANSLFQTSSTVSTKVFGSKRDPIFAIFRFANPKH